MIVIREQPKIYPIVLPDPMEEVVVYPMDHPDAVGTVTEEEIKKIRRNILRLYKWGTENQIILQEINKQAAKELEKTDEEIRAEVLESTSGNSTN